MKNIVSHPILASYTLHDPLIRFFINSNTFKVIATKFSERMKDWVNRCHSIPESKYRDTAIYEVLRPGVANCFHSCDAICKPPILR